MSLHTPRQELSNPAERVLAGAVCGAALIGAFQAGHEYSEYSHTTPDTQANLIVENAICQPPTQEITDVRSLLAKPPRIPVPPNVEGARTNIRGVFQDDDPRLSVAKELGLTLHTAPTQSVPDNTPLDKRGEAELKTTQDFARLYGIDVSLSTQADKKDHRRPLITKELNGNAAHLIMSGLRLELSSVPVEYVKAIGVRAVELYFAESRPGHGYAVGYVNPAKPGIVHIGIAHGERTATGFLHEIAHSLDAKECGPNLDKDPAYTALNQGDIYRRKNPENTEEYYAEKFRTTSIPGKTTPAEAHDLLDIPAYSVVAASKYALTSPGEDKAELGMLLSEPLSYQNILDPRKFRLQEKAVLLLSRLHQLAPKVAEFFIATGTRPHNP